MGIDARNEIEHWQRQIARQNKDISRLRRAGIDTGAALLLLSRMQDKVDGLIGERNRLSEEAVSDRRTYASGKTIRGTPPYRR